MADPHDNEPPDILIWEEAMSAPEEVRDQLYWGPIPPKEELAPQTPLHAVPPTRGKKPRTRRGRPRVYPKSRFVPLPEEQSPSKFLAPLPEEEAS